MDIKLQFLLGYYSYVIAMLNCNIFTLKYSRSHLKLLTPTLICFPHLNTQIFKFPPEIDQPEIPKPPIKLGGSPMISIFYETCRRGQSNPWHFCKTFLFIFNVWSSVIRKTLLFERKNFLLLFESEERELTVFIYFVLLFYSRQSAVAGIFEMACEGI